MLLLSSFLLLLSPPLPAGYHRVWSIDQQCLGEMALPNLLEKMKNTMGQVTLNDTAFIRFASLCNVASSASVAILCMFLPQLID
jgi:hypothetical protein